MSDSYRTVEEPRQGHRPSGDVAHPSGVALLWCLGVSRVVSIIDVLIICGLEETERLTKHNY